VPAKRVGDVAEVLQAQLMQRADLRTEVAHPVVQPVGERRVDETAVPPGRTEPDRPGLEQHDVTPRILFLGLDRRPQAGEPAADDDQAGVVVAGQPGRRRRRVLAI